MSCTTALGCDEGPRLYKPAPPHNRLLGPAACLCVECSRKVLTLRCEATDDEGRQCGDYKGHIPRKEHSLLVVTVFQIAEERVKFAESGGRE